MVYGEIPYFLNEEVKILELIKINTLLKII